MPCPCKNLSNASEALRMCDEKSHFPPVRGLSFILLTVSLAEKTFFILMKSSFCFFLLWCHVFHVVYKDSLPKLRSQRSFSQKCYGFILYIYFEVIFV